MSSISHQPQQPPDLSDHEHQPPAAASLCDLPENVLVDLVKAECLETQEKRSLRASCKTLLQLVDVHALRTMSLQAVDDLPALADSSSFMPPEQLAASAQTWQRLRSRCYSHLTQLEMINTPAERAAQLCTCMAPTLSSLRKVHVAGVRDLAPAVLAPLLLSSAESSVDSLHIETSDSLADADGSLACSLLVTLGRFRGLRALQLKSPGLMLNAAQHSAALATLSGLTRLVANVATDVVGVLPSLRELELQLPPFWDVGDGLARLTLLTSLKLPVCFWSGRSVRTFTSQTIDTFITSLPAGLVILNIEGGLPGPARLYAQNVQQLSRLTSLTELDTQGLTISCGALTNLTRLTSLTCNSLVDDSIAGGTSSVAAHAPQQTLRSLVKLDLSDGGVRSGCLARACPALEELTVHPSNRRELVHHDAAEATATSERLFGGGGALPGLRQLTVPVYLLSHPAVATACSGITCLEIGAIDISPRTARYVAARMLPLAKLVKVVMHCESLGEKLTDVEDEANTRLAGDILLQGVAACKGPIKQLIFQGRTVEVSEKGIASLVQCKTLGFVTFKEVKQPVFTKSLVRLLAAQPMMCWLHLVDCGPVGASEAAAIMAELPGCHIEISCAATYDSDAEVDVAKLPADD